MESEPTRILIAVNQSSLMGYPHPSISCRNAFEWTLAKIVRSNIAGFKLLFLHVQIPDEDGFDDMDSIYASPEDFQSMKQRDRIRGLHLLEYFVGCCHQLGISCEAWIRKGGPNEVICSEVNRVHPDILVLGSRGLGPFQREGVQAGLWVRCFQEHLADQGNGLGRNCHLLDKAMGAKVFVGTVSEFCVKHADCPVITIKRKADEAPQDPVDD